MASAASAIRNFGKEPNRDVWLGGYDNYWSDCWEHEYDPTAPAATVDRQNPALGQELVTLLLDRLQGRTPLGPQRRAVKPKLVVTDPADSTSVPPALALQG
jgi:DNA-binding LacI/PurR family transcriptional regulator